MAKTKTGGGSEQRLKVTPEVLSKIKTLAGMGFTHNELSSYYGYSKGGWFELIKNNPTMKTMYREGKAKTLELVVGKLMEKVLQGNLSAIIFYLKTQYRWSEHTTFSGTFKNKAGALTKTPPLANVDPTEAAKIYSEIMTGA